MKYLFFCLCHKYSLFSYIWDERKKLDGHQLITKSSKSQGELEIYLEYLNKHVSLDTTKVDINRTIFCDAGTGRIGNLEIRITDFNSVPLLQNILNNSFLNDAFNISISFNEFTVNFGELLSFYYALLYAIKFDILNIFSDSAIVVLYWLFYRQNIESVDRHTNFLISIVRELLIKHKNINYFYISRVYNKADLGFIKKM